MPHRHNGRRIVLLDERNQFSEKVTAERAQRLIESGHAEQVGADRLRMRRAEPQNTATEVEATALWRSRLRPCSDLPTLSACKKFVARANAFRGQR